MRCRRAFTLVELLIVIAIVALLVALLIPAINAAREAGRRTACANNLRQTGLALLNYEGVQRRFPVGSASTKAGGPGFSWWVKILPYAEQGQIYRRLDKTSDAIGFVGHQGNAHNRDVLHGVRFPFMVCPASRLREFGLYGDANANARVASPMFTGISGATNHKTTREKESMGVVPGRISAGGVLIRHKAIRMSQIKDGGSKTMMVGEQSDLCHTALDNRADCRSDCGHGFCMGIRRDGRDESFNVTTVLHGIGEKTWVKYGISGDCGPNRPIQSVHPRGAHALLVDGAVRLLGDDTALQIVYNLANRDDEQNQQQMHDFWE